MSTLVMLSTVAAVVILPLVIGSLLARWLRMPDYAWKFMLCLFVLAFGATVTYWGWRTDNIRTGIDLSGGVIMVYQIEGEEAIDAQKADQLIAAISRRINPGGVKEVTIRRLGADQVEIIVPKVDEAEAVRIENIISKAGRLEFRILADRRHQQDLIDRAMKEDVVEIKDPGDKEWAAKWVPVEAGEESSFLGRGYEGVARREREVGGKKRLEILVINDNYDVTGDYLTKASPGTDRQGRPAVNFSFDAWGAELFGELTSTHLPEQGGQYTSKLGIILDGFLYSAPSIQSKISDRGEITGSFTEQEVTDLVNVLNAGALPATLSQEPISKLVIGPTLGRDTIKRSANAILIAMILVPIFMVGYYRFSGLVANLALVMNLLAILAIMISVKAALTLAGLAGLALTVAMAVDNNVLVYERLREERDRGATIRMAIRNGFARASAVIIDANVTTIIAAVVLYVIGTDQVRGFAVALFLGVALSMFTSIWVSRVLFDVAERKRWLTELKMLKLIGETKVNFMKLFPVTATLSAVVILAGLVAVWQRGKGLLDIDFTGGVSVQIVFKEGQEQHDTGKVRELVSKKAELPDVVVSDAQIADEPIGKRFMINTSEQELPVVEERLERVFGDKLETNRVAVEKLEPIAAEKSEEKKAEAEAAPTSPYAGGSRAELTLHLPINEPLLREAYDTAMRKLDIADPGQTEFSNPEYQTGDTKSYLQWTVRSRLPESQLKSVLAKMDEDFRGSPYFAQSNKIGGAVAANTRLQAIYALAASWVCMLVYLWIRFQGVGFGLAAVVALVHDVLVMLAFVAGSYWLATFLGFMYVDQFKINLTMVAAFLTIIGYSVNDTIIVFDRLREVRGKMPVVTPEMVNQSVNQTLSRTLITSFTVLLVCSVLYFLGGEAMRGMAFALVVGVVSGTYSSIYVASPVLLWMMKPRGETAKVVASQQPAGVR